MGNVFGNYQQGFTNGYSQPAINNNPYYQQQNQSYSYPVNYQNYTTNQPSGGIIWVSGEQQAKSYQVPQGFVVPLFDSESQTIYLRFTDTQGRPQTTILDYTERGSDDKQDVKRDDKKGNVGVEYITREQFDNLNQNVATKEQLGVLNEQFSSINNKLKELSNFATVDQIKSFGERLDDLDNQINDIEDRITSFGKPQNNSNSNNRRGNK